MLKVGLVGLPNAGKSTLFNFLTQADALVAPYPFSTVTPNKATLKLYDENALKLAKAIDSPDIKHTEVEVWDIAGLVHNASQGEGLGNEFLGQIKDCDVIIHVVRVTQGEPKGALMADMQTIWTEIARFDHKCLLKPFEKGRRMRRMFPNEPAHAQTDELITKVYYGTRDGRPIFDLVSDDEELATLRELGLVSSKPRLLLCNVDDDRMASRLAKEVQADLSVNLLELEALSSMTAEERTFLGYSAQPIQEVMGHICDLLVHRTHSKCFYTVGHLGVGQYVVGAGANAATCSELVHAELSAEIRGVRVAALDDFMAFGSWAELKRKGLVRKYGQRYQPADGEILYFEIT